MAAYRQAKRMQSGVRLGYNQGLYASSTLKFTSSPIHIGTDDFSIEFWGNTYGSNTFYQPAVFFNNAGDGTFSISTQPAGTNGVDRVYFGRGISGDTAEDILYLNWVAPTQEGMFHCVVTRSGTLVKCFIEGEQKEQKTQTLLHDYGDVTIGIANSSNMGFVRVWNYALSADEIATLYNNGDPMGYVVPKAMRGLESVEITGSNSYTWDAENQDYFYAITGKPMYIGKLYRVNITVSNYESGSPFIYTDKNYPIPAQNGTYDIEIGIAYKNSFGIYGGLNNTDRRLTLTVNSITPVGLLAEYLPQNLMGSRKGHEVEPMAETFEFNVGDENYKRVISIAYPPYTSIYRVDYIVDEWNYDPAPIDTVGFGFSFNAKYLSGTYKWQTLEAAKIGELQSFVFEAPSGNAPEVGLYATLNDEGAITRRLKVTIVGITPVSVPNSWLDSAKQLPLSDEYMEPLFQSIGGYDMAANGAPEILYNE